VVILAIEKGYTGATLQIASGMNTSEGDAE